MVESSVEVPHEHERPATTPNMLIEALNNHASSVVERSPTSTLYADEVRMCAQEVQKLILAQTGEVKGVVISWRDYVQPIAELIFGRNLDGEQIGALQEYAPTVFNGIYGRTRILSNDEVFGPTISLDLAAEDSLITR